MKIITKMLLLCTNDRLKVSMKLIPDMLGGLTTDESSENITGKSWIEAMIAEVDLVVPKAETQERHYQHHNQLEKHITVEFVDL